MKHSDFVHLHNHSDYSLLDGASAIPAMVEKAARLRMPALALTDHGSMFGAVEFYEAARKAGVKPVIGMEAYVTRGSRRDRTKDTAHHLVLLARDEQGFKNLMKLSSIAFLEGFYYKPRLDHEILSQHAAGLLALSACPKGEIATDLLEDRDDAALATAMMYRDMFGPEHYFLEIQNHGLPIEEKIRAKVIALAARTGLPLVATNDCHYLEASHVQAQDTLICIQTGKNVDDVQRMRAVEQLHFRTPDEMKAVFESTPEAIRNTLTVAERCNVQMQFGKPLLPEFPLPEGWRDADSYFRDLAWRELHERFRGEVSETLRTRFAYELDVICKMGFASYFLIVRDFIAFARSKGIGVGPGRGSVAGSLVAYAVHITDVDPIKHGLIFERFLNPERVSMPDIDIDFDDLRRPEVIEYVKQKYGEQNVTQIITFGTMGAKGVVRDVGRALGLPVAEVDRVAKLVPDGLGMTLARALELAPDLKALPQKGPVYARLLENARVLEGLARHASTHAAGVLITPGPLTDYVPLYRQKDGSTTTQWDMKAVEKAGLLKMDFLGLRTLSVLQECVDLVQKHHGVTLDLEHLPEGDADAFKVFQSGETVAIFQFESGGMRDYLKKLKPTVFEDLVAMNALYRPGPMENIPYFIDCKHGRKVARYEHPKLEPILKGTYGVFVYQEQVMGAAHDLAGFSMAQADELRRAMGKKIAEEMTKKGAQFVEGCAKHSRIPERSARSIFETMEKFAGYGFNKCLTSDTRVFDATGGAPVTIKELFDRRRPMQVLALGSDQKLRPREVIDVVSNGVRPVFELVTALGHRIKATANHPFRVLDGWRLLGELAPGDRIAAPRVLPASPSTSLERHELVTLAGLLSEGNTCHPSTLYFYNNDPVLTQDFASAAAEFPDTVVRTHERGDGRLEVAVNLGRVATAREDDHDYQIDTAGNMALVQERAPRRCGAFQWAQTLGIIGKKASEKRAPSVVFGLEIGKLELFLGRLWAGDGFIANHALCVPFYATSSQGLASDVQMLLARIGIVSAVRTKRFRYRGSVRMGWTVQLVGTESVEKFAEKIAPHCVGRTRGVDFLREHLAKTARDRSSRDTIPPEIRERVARAREVRGLTWLEVESQSGVSMKEFTGSGSHAKRGFRRSTIRKLAHYFDDLSLLQTATSDIFWDRVVSIEPCGEQETFDLTVEEDHNFVAEGLVVHNSHSAAYALVAYQCGYLKGHYPAEFMAATMTSEMHDSARLVTLIEECRRLGIELRAPDVARSQWKFTIEDGAIRLGLGAVRNVGQGAAEAILAARDAGEPFRDLFDLASRVPGNTLNRRVIESLVSAGACDSFGAPRERLFAGVELTLQAAASLHREQESGQASLFGGDAGASAVAIIAPPLPSVPEWTSRERSAREKEVLGFYLTEHPLEHLRDELEAVATHGIAQVLESGDGAEVRIVGLVGEKKQITTRAGKLMGVVVLEDLTGRVECTFFPEAYEQSRQLLEADTILVVEGRIEVRDDRGAKLLVSNVRPWEQGRQDFRPALHLELRATELSEPLFLAIDEVLARYPGDAEVYLHIVKPDHAREVLRARRYRVRMDEGLITGLKQSAPSCKVRWHKGAS